MPILRKGFTLVELLVVVAIIVVLLALLLPAMSRAVYFAELVKCSTQLKLIASKLHLYTLDNKGWYPYRPGPAGVAGWAPSQLSNRAFDDRATLRHAAEIALMNDPLSTAVNLETTQPGCLVYGSYSLWYGMRGGVGEKNMDKRSDSWTYKGVVFNVLITDSDGVRPEVTTTGGAGYNDALANHPDREYTAQLAVYQDYVNAFVPIFSGGSASTSITASQWSQHPAKRQPLDLNFALDDGAVTRYHEVKYEDERMARWDYSTGHYINLPR